MKYFISKALFTAVFLLLRLLAAAQGGNDRINSIDVLRYDFELTLSDSTERISGKATVQVKLLKAANSLHLDLVATNAAGKGMKVSEIKSDGKGLEFKHLGEDLEILLPGNQAAGTELKLVIAYAGIPADGLIISDSNEDGRSFFGDN